MNTWKHIESAKWNDNHHSNTVNNLNDERTRNTFEAALSRAVKVCDNEHFRAWEALYREGKYRQAIERLAVTLGGMELDLGLLRKDDVRASSRLRCGMCALRIIFGQWPDVTRYDDDCMYYFERSC